MFLHSNLLFVYKTLKLYGFIVTAEEPQKPKSPVIVKLVHILSMIIFFEFPANSRGDRLSAFLLPPPRETTIILLEK